MKRGLAVELNIAIEDRLLINEHFGIDIKFRLDKKLLMNNVDTRQQPSEITIISLILRVDLFNIL